MKKDSVIYYVIGAVVAGLAVALVAIMFFSDTTEKSARVFFEKVLVPNAYSNWNFEKFKGYLSRKAAPAGSATSDEAKYMELFSNASEKLGNLKSLSTITAEKTEYIDIDSGKTVFIDLNADASYAKGAARIKTRLVQNEDSWRVVSLDIISAALIAKPVQEQKEKASAPAAAAKPSEQLKPAQKPESKKAEVAPAVPAPAAKPVVQQPAVQPKKPEMTPQPAPTKQPVVQPKPEQKPAVKPPVKPPVAAVQQPQPAKQQPVAQAKPLPKPEEKIEKTAAPAVQPAKPASYTYDPKNRRDPFYPLIVKADTEKRAGLTPLENYEISDFKLIAILKEKVKGYYAVVTLPNNRSYNLREGIKIGMHDGKVMKINRDSVVIREYHRDLKGVLSPKDTILKLRREEEG
ncbi:MAG: pilus assembly protein PilP [Nitrospiraceae bacterium]|nr:pilus assembly protein PilP [Nitrospiraceae bacterium]